MSDLAYIPSATRLSQNSTAITNGEISISLEERPVVDHVFHKRYNESDAHEDNQALVAIPKTAAAPDVIFSGSMRSLGIMGESTMPRAGPTNQSTDAATPTIS